MKRILFIIFFSTLMLQGAFAQKHKVSGLVREKDNNEPLPGVTVYEKGTSNGTVTDTNGEYSLSVNLEATLSFSFIGMKSEEVKIGESSVVNVFLESDTEELEEVVATAMGITRKKKELNYAAQEVKGAVVSNTEQSNVAESLAGRIAGVNIVNTSGDVGNSTSIVIRGGASLGGNNQPIFIVDGVPIDNTSVSSRNFDDVNRAADIEPEDVASISVLKGPAAAALYGINAASGAIVITTKRGEKGVGRIVYSNNFKWSEVVNLPEVQQKYQFGFSGAPSSSGYYSWGPPITEGTKMYNNLENFFETGFEHKHRFEFSNSTKDGNYLFSLTYRDQKGIVPESDYNTTSMRLNTTKYLKKWLTVDASANYVHAESDKSAKGVNGFYNQLLMHPVNLDAKDWINDDGTYKSITGYEASTDNPYFTIKNNRTESKTNRILTNLNLTIKPIKDFFISSRIGSDFYTTRGRYYIVPGSTIASVQDGYLQNFQRTSHVLNLNLLMNYDKTINEDLHLSIMAGSSIEDYDYWSDYTSGSEFQNPDFIGIANIETSTLATGSNRTQRRRTGVFGEFKLDYKKALYLGMTARNDWSSTLPAVNNSFFYPSYSLGFIFSEFMNNHNILSFGKIRASWAQVGKDASPYVVGTSLSVNDKSGGGFYNGYSGGNDQLKPETTTALELGADLRFFKGRFSLDFTYYDQESKDMIINPRLSYGTGYIFFYMNGGTISNKGLEIQGRFTPVKTKNLEWNFIANYNKNKGVLESLPYPLEEYYESDTWVYGNIRNGAKPGEPYSGLTGFDYERTDDGRVVVDSNGIPIREAKYITVGDREPDFQLGLTNMLKYKKFELSFLFDIRVGYDVYNGTKAFMTDHGASKLTEERGKQFIVDGVVADGTDEMGNVIYKENTTPVVLDQNFYRFEYADVESNFIEHVNSVRLRNLSFSYRLDSKKLKSKFFEDITLKFTGYNLALWSNYTGGDPEVNTLGAGNRGSGGSGIDYGALPSPRSYSIGLKVKF